MIIHSLLLTSAFKQQNKMQKLTQQFDKISATILSCDTPLQLEGAYRMLHNFFVLHSTKVGQDTFSITGNELEAFEALKEIYEDKKKTFTND